MSNRRTVSNRYGAHHRWLRRKALRTMTLGQACPRCGKPLLPKEFEVSPGQYALPRGWMSKNLHLDHSDDGIGYLGLSHATCNIRAGGTSR